MIQLSSDHHYQQNAIHRGKENCNTYALTKRKIPRRLNRKSSAEDMYRIYRAREKEERSRQKHKRCQIEKDILQEDGL